MSLFKTQAVLVVVENGWELAADLIYKSDYLKKTVTVPQGFRTDLASVPWPFSGLIVPTTNARNRAAAIVHDYLCHDAIQAWLGISQKDADLVFFEALEVVGLPKWKRLALFLPVRGFQAIKGVFK